MDIPLELNIQDFRYNLPESRIAKFPLKERDKSKLLVYDKGEISTRIFSDLPSIFSSGEMLVFNNTKVIRARLIFKKPTGAAIEIFCLEPYEPSDYALAFSIKGKALWKCITGNLKKWKGGRLISDNNGIKLYATLVENNKDLQIIMFEWDAPVTFGELLEISGFIPIPPYLNRKSEPLDGVRYQTVYSKYNGSVAAPTAGLHFSPEVLDALKNNQISCEEITLHVGAGTFKPVQEDDISKHILHEEHFTVSLPALKNIHSRLGSVTAVGTTSVRTLESLYYIGIKIADNPDLLHSGIHVGQWDPYKTTYKETADKAIGRIIEGMEKYNLDILHASTSIMIIPGYNFKLVNKLITNFHQPDSTLLLLIAAFIGNDWKKVYDYALTNDFRFLSYGDSSILEPCKK